MTTANNDRVKFNDIDDPSIKLMLEQLPAKFLLECGRSCKRIRDLSREQFLREFSMDEVQIKFLDDGRLNITPCEKHFNHYDNVFKNVSIESWYFERNKNLKLANLTNFMMKKCSQNLSKIHIRGDIELVQFGQNIGEILRNVERVEFQNRKRPVDEAQFLRLCPNLKKLILGVAIDNDIVDTILGQRYQQLTHFCYMYGDAMNLKPDKLMEFFQRNEKLKSISWKFRMCDEATRHRSVDCIETLRFIRHLRHALFSFADQLPKYTTRQFDIIRNQMNIICGQDTFRSLEIEMVCPRESSRYAPLLLARMRGFAEWQNLTTIHLYRYPMSIMIPTLRMLVHLRSMLLYDCLFEEPVVDSSDEGSSSSDDTGDNAPMALPQVREIYIKNGCYNDLTSICMLPIKYWRNLNRILVPVISNSICLDIAALNRARQNLNNACEVTIFTNNKYLPTNMQHTLVKLKCVNSVNMVRRRR